MPETRDIVLCAWGVVLLGVAFSRGIRSVLSTLFLGAGPAVVLATMYADALAPITGLYTKRELDAAKKEVKTLERAETMRRSAGGESLDWLNLLVKQLWPHIAKYVEEMIKGYESMIQNRLPVGGSKIRFTTCTLGKEHLKFGSVTPRLVDAVLSGGETLKENGLELEIGVSYNSDVDIVLSSPIASVGIADLKINGTLSVIFRPLLSESPFIGGMEILFTNPPEIDVDFKGLGNVADMPGIYTAVRRTIHDAIAGIMVAPNRKAFAISGDPKVSLGHLKNPRPEGVLRLTVIKAESLEGNDLNYNLTKTSDPYVEVKVGCTRWRTPTIQKNCNPVWSHDNVHDFFFNSAGQNVHIDVFDEDKLTDDDHLGCIKGYTVKTLMDVVGRWGGQRGQQRAGGRRSDQGFCYTDCCGGRDADSFGDGGTDGKAFALHAHSDREKAPPEAARLYIKAEVHRFVPLTTPPAEPGLNNFVMSFRAIEIEGLPDSGLGAPYTLKLSVAGDAKRTAVSNQGWPRYSASTTPADLKHVQKLLDRNIEPKVIAEVMLVDVKIIEALAAKKLPVETDDAKYQEWITKLDADRSQREAAINPQFEEVLRIPVAERNFTAVVELVGTKAKGKVVGRFEVKIGDPETIEGPFVIQDPATGRPLSRAACKSAFLPARLPSFMPACLPLPSCLVAQDPATGKPLSRDGEVQAQLRGRFLLHSLQKSHL